jgi:hypothetical protein
MTDPGAVLERLGRGDRLPDVDRGDRAGIKVRSFTVDPRSGIPGGGSVKCLPANEKRSFDHAALMISIDSSNSSRLMRSSSADISLSPDATTPPSDCASRGTVPRPTPNCMRLPGEDLHRGGILGETQRMPLRHHVEHLAETQPLGLLGQVQTEEDQVGRDLVALVLEVMLGEPHRVVAEAVHRAGPVQQVVVAGDHVVVAVAPVDGRRAPVAGVGHRDGSVEVGVDPHVSSVPGRCFAGVNGAVGGDVPEHGPLEKVGV